MTSSSLEYSAAGMVRQLKNAIFLLGIMPRSGTNFVHKLITLHPDCGERTEIPEDRLLIPADQLATYAARVAGGWKRSWNVPDAERELLLRSLGDGLIGFLAASVKERFVVTKTPSVHNIELFPDLFPSAPLLVLVRDGRAVADSAARTFGWSPGHAMRRWAEAARAIIAFDASRSGTDTYLLVRYEDLVRDLDQSLPPVLEWCGLDPERYPFAKAREVPLLGSSVYRGGQREVHWQPVDRPRDFAARIPWSRWSRSLHEEFTLVAGAEMRSLGYDGADLPMPRLGARVRRLAGDLAFRRTRPPRL